jgi:hypothetical protein
MGCSSHISSKTGIEAISSNSQPTFQRAEKKKIDRKGADRHSKATTGTTSRIYLSTCKRYIWKSVATWVINMEKISQPKVHGTQTHFPLA